MAATYGLYFDLIQDTKRYVQTALLAADFLDGVEGLKAFQLAASLRAQADCGQPRLKLAFRSMSDVGEAT